MWGYLKDRVFQRNPANINELKQIRTENFVNNINNVAKSIKKTWFGVIMFAIKMMANSYNICLRNDNVKNFN